MEGLLIILVVLLVLSGPVGLFIGLASLGRLRRMEAELDELRRAPRASGAERSADPTSTIPTTSAAPPTPDGTGAGAPMDEPLPWDSEAGQTPPPLPASQFSRSTQSTESEETVEKRPGGRDLESWIGAEWLTWIGVVAILFGTAFFLAVSLDTHPLAGMGQVAIGAGVAVGFLAVGSWLLGRTGFFLAQGLLGGGTALLFLAIYAATEFHGLLETPVAYVFLALTSVAGAVLAVSKDSRTVATLTLIGALLTPLVMEPQPQHSLFFPYLFFVNLGTVVVRLRKDWPALVLGAYLATVFLVFLWWESRFSDTTRWEALGGVGALWLLYFALPFLARTTTAVWRTAGTVLVFANAMAGSLFFSNWVQADSAAAQASALLGLIYIFVARVVAPRLRAPLGIIYELAGLILLAIAIPKYFGQTATTVAWAVGALAILWLGTATRSLGHRLVGYGLLVGAALRHLSLDIDFDLIEPGTLSGQWISGLVATCAILGCAALLYRTSDDNLTRSERELRTPVLVAALAFLLEVLTLQTWRHLEPSGERRALLGVSWVWGLYGAALIATGFWTRLRAVRLSGVALLLALVVKIFTVDLAVLDRGERIASFVGVGVLLLVISVLYQRKKGT